MIPACFPSGRGESPARVVRRREPSRRVRIVQRKEGDMRIGKPWRLGVLVTLLFLLSGQFCMLTTCLPRLARQHAAAHACCPGQIGRAHV